ncbi:MAG: fused MFS/spermidine synthase [Rhodospirillales bacterium]|nr:fused MFS/spermidine synthase [Rhodospirillales bacterium]
MDSPSSTLPVVADGAPAPTTKEPIPQGPAGQSLTGKSAVVGLLVLSFLSGFAGLGYEIVWTRMLSVTLGHEIFAVLAVIAAFFIGLALGAWTLDRWICASRVPRRWYAALELIIGASALALAHLIPWASGLAPRLLGTDPAPVLQWSVAFALPFLLLLPATAAMGGTLPALERLITGMGRGNRWVGATYAANTFGAVAGTGIATTVIAPALGFSTSLVVFAGINAACAAAMLIGPAHIAGPQGRRPVERRSAAPRSLPQGASGTEGQEADREANRGHCLAVLFVTGCLGLGYEVLVVRVLSQILENTVYTFAAVLCVYLLGTAIGAAAYQRAQPRLDIGRTARALLLATAATCVAGTTALWAAPSVHAMVRVWAARAAVAPLGGAILAEAIVALAIFFPPTVCMGALFSHLAQAVRSAGGGFGRALGINMLGGALAPLLFGVLLLPQIGAKTALVITALGYLLAAVLWPRSLTPRSLARPQMGAAGVVVLLALGLLLFAPPLRFIRVPPGGNLIAHADGVMAGVSVITDAQGERHLQVNSHFRMGGTVSQRSDHREALIPLLLHPEPRSALFLGLGTGATLAAAAQYPGLRSEAVELVPEIVDLLPEFAAATGDLGADPNLALHVADARRFVRATNAGYDVIVADLFHPWIDGAGFLYTREHFAAVRARLAPGGLFCQWLPLHQLDLPTLQVIVRTFLDVFPDADAFLATFSLETPIVALVGTTAPIRRDDAWLERRAQADGIGVTLDAEGLSDSLALFGLYLGGAETLRRFAGPGPLNTDDRPVVLFDAPRAAYALRERPAERLLTLIDRLQPQPGEILPADAPSAASRLAASRLAAYWQARRQFLLAGLRPLPSADVRTVARTLAPELLAIVRVSPDFDPAYRPLLAIARQLSYIDAPAAAALLVDLQRANPMRPEAQVLREQLATAPR